MYCNSKTRIARVFKKNLITETISYCVILGTCLRGTPHTWVGMSDGGLAK